MSTVNASIEDAVYAVAAIELVAIALIRKPFLRVSLAQSLVQVTLGGAMVAGVGFALGQAWPWLPRSQDDHRTGSIGDPLSRDVLGAASVMVSRRRALVLGSFCPWLALVQLGRADAARSARRMRGT